MIKHLSIRVAWHDNKWNGTVCNHPSQNSYCIHLSRIYDKKKDEDEDKIAGIQWSKLSHQKLLPPCKAEGGGFMSKLKFDREFEHPHGKSKKSTSPHRVLSATLHEIPPYCGTAVPFWWMLSKNQDEIRILYPDVPRDKSAPFATPWVYTKETQNALLEKFFGPVQEDMSLAIFYVKGPNPVDEDSRRLIAGIGLIKKKSKILTYTTSADYTYPIWDRLLQHGIRPGEKDSEGVLLPYHDYLSLPDDFVLKTGDGKKNKDDLLSEIKLTLQGTGSREEVMDEFTYGSSWVADSSVLIVLGKLRVVIERIKDHGIALGNWDDHLLWIDRQIGKVKSNMGPFPSFANALIAFGFLYGHTLEDDLRKNKIIGPKDDPWDAWEEVIYGRKNLGNTVYRGQLGLVQSTFGSYANVVFAGVDEDVTFGYQGKSQMDNDDTNLELAYAITVHKSQGSDFDFVFLVIPKTGKIISRELVYTALTRAKKKLILLVEGDSPHWIINLSKPQYSETGKRNTHIFRPAVRLEKSTIPFAEGLIHKTKKEGLLVRSKSEVIIANMLIEKNIDFEYEKQYIGKTGEKRIPDFTFTDFAGETIVLEHLGMLEIPSYESDWTKKQKFYKDNGFKFNETLFTTSETEKGGIDSIAIEQVINTIHQLIS